MASIATGLQRWALGEDPRLQLRVSQSLLVLCVYGVFAVVQHSEVVLGLIDEAQSWALTAWNLSGGVLFYALVRFDAKLPLMREPAWSVSQSLWAMVGISWSYAITGPARGGVLLIMMLVIVFTLFALTPAQARALAALGFAMIGGVMVFKALTDPVRYDPRVEVLHLVFSAIVMSATGVLAVRLGKLRAKLVAQRGELASALARIQHLATHDELTGMINRRHMLELLEQERQRSERAGHSFCVALLDIDHFKHVNDAHGHAAGDEVLRRFAAVARDAVRGADQLARWGGEEFVLMLVDTALPVAQGGVDRVRERVAAAAMSDGAVPLHVTVSAGLAQGRAGESISQLMERADRALYEAKAQGRNRTVVE
jgi:diguanylate cyclase (GGDEF)-like protein